MSPYSRGTDQSSLASECARAGFLGQSGVAISIDRRLQNDRCKHRIPQSGEVFKAPCNDFIESLYVIGPTKTYVMPDKFPGHGSAMPGRARVMRLQTCRDARLVQNPVRMRGTHQWRDGPFPDRGASLQSQCTFPTPDRRIAP